MDILGWTLKRTLELSADDVVRVMGEGNAVDGKRWVDNLKKMLARAEREGVDLEAARIRQTLRLIDPDFAQAECGIVLKRLTN